MIKNIQNINVAEVRYSKRMVFGADNIAVNDTLVANRTLHRARKYLGRKPTSDTNAAHSDECAARYYQRE
jgi:hypothetical protein